MKFTDTNNSNVTVIKTKISDNVTIVKTISEGITLMAIVNSSEEEHEHKSCCDELNRTLVTISNWFDSDSEVSFENNTNTSSQTSKSKESQNNFEIQFIIDLDLPNIEVIDIVRDENGIYHITVKSTLCGTNCKRCAIHTSHIHKNGREITLRDLSILGSRVFVKISPLRYKCKHCNLISTQQMVYLKKFVHVEI